MSDLKNDNKQIRLTGSAIDDPESKQHLIAYSELIRRDINSIKEYINNTSVNAFRTLAYEDKFEIDGVSDGIDGQTVITKYDSSENDGELVWSSINQRQKSIYESLIHLRDLIRELSGTTNETDSGFDTLIDLLRNDLNSLRDMTVGESRSYNDQIDPSVAEHLYQLITQCFTIVGEGVGELVPDPYNNNYNNIFTLNLNVNRENINSCNDDYENLNEELSSLYGKLIGADCFSNDNHFGVGGGNCFGENITSSLKETVGAFEDKICDNSRRIDDLESGVVLGNFNPATSETLGVVELATSAEVSTINSSSNGNPLVMTPSSLFGYYNSALENNFLMQPAGNAYNKVFGFCFNQKNIEELKNVRINSPQNNQSLVYADGNWINKLVENNGGGAVDSVNGNTGDVVLDSENVLLGSNIVGLGNTNNSVHDALVSLYNLTGNLEPIAFSGQSADANVVYNPSNYTLQNPNISNVETHLEGIDDKLNSVIPQSATTEVEGIVELADEVEALSGSDTVKVITPATLKTVLLEQPFVRFSGVNISNLGSVDYPIKRGIAFVMFVPSSTPHRAFGKDWRNGDVFIANEDIQSFTTNYRDVIKITNAERINNLSNVAFTGSYNDLTSRPILGTAAPLDAGTAAGNVVVVDENGKIPSSLLDLEVLGAGIDNVETIEISVDGAIGNDSADIRISANISNKVLTRVILNVSADEKYKWIDVTSSLEENKKIIFEIKSVNDYASMVNLRVVTGGSTTFYPMSTKGNEYVIYNHKVNNGVRNFKRCSLGCKKQLGKYRLESGLSNYYYFCSEEDSLIFAQNPVVSGNSPGVIDITGAWNGFRGSSSSYHDRLSKFYGNLNQKITILNTGGYTNLRVRYYDESRSLVTENVTKVKEEFYLCNVSNGWPCYIRV